jgi:hypothetical protein
MRREMMMRTIKSFSLAIIFATSSATVWAKEIKFSEFITSVPCATQVRSQIPARLQSQVWLFSESGGNGWEFRDTIEMKSYEISWKDFPTKQADLIERPIFVTSGSAQHSVWDPAKSCAVETSTEPYVPQPISRLSPTGFSDNDLKELLKTHNWGVIYLASPQRPGLSVLWLKSVKTVVDEKGGHLTVILDSAPLASNETGFSASQLGLLRNNGGSGASGLKPLASREIFDRHLHGGPEALVYLKGFLSNRTLPESYSLAGTKKAIQDELDDLVNDLNAE